MAGLYCFNCGENLSKKGSIYRTNVEVESFYYDEERKVIQYWMSSTTDEGNLCCNECDKPLQNDLSDLNIEY